MSRARPLLLLTLALSACVDDFSDDWDNDGHPASSDCDDHDATIHPGAPETWYDGVDDDCDGNLDDADGDGFPAVQTGGEDCDDADAAVHPGAEEVCRDGRDNDCSGDATGCERAAEGTSDDRDGVLHGASPVDHASFVAPLGDVDLDGHADFLIGANRAEGATEDHGGAIYRVMGGEAFDRLLTPEERIVEGDRLEGEIGDRFSAGDVTGDAEPDVVVGDRSGGDAEQGLVCVVPGPHSGTRRPGDWGCFAGAMPGTALGTQVSAGGDVDGDQIADLIFSGLGLAEDGSVFAPGAVYVATGPLTTPLPALDSVARVLGTEDDTGELLAMTTGELDGSGVHTLVIGVKAADTAITDGGAVHLLGGPFSGERSLADSDLLIEGTRSGLGLGGQVAVVQDVDGDGADDLLVITRGTSGYSTNAAYLYLGPFDLGAGQILTEGDAHATLAGEGTLFGIGIEAATSAGDTDGDGLGDLVLGAPNFDIDLDGDGVKDECDDDDPCPDGDDGEYGAAWLLLGPFEGAVDIQTHSRIEGLRSEDHFADSVAGVGDVNNDGFDDIALGAEYYDSIDPDDGDPMTNSGATFLFWGMGQ